MKGKPGTKGNICYHLSSLLKILTKETNDQGSANDPLRMSSPSAVKNLRKIWKNYNQFRLFPIFRIFFFSCNTNSDTEMLKSHLKAGLWILSIRKGQGVFSLERTLGLWPERTLSVVNATHYFFERNSSFDFGKSKLKYIITNFTSNYYIFSITLVILFSF